MKVKVKDLNLAMDYIKTHGYSEYVEFEEGELGGAALAISFIDKQQKACKIYLYQSDKGITPEVRVTSKLYKQE
jgi:hypothetical protein